MAKRGSTAPQGRRIFLKGFGSQGQQALGDFRWTSPRLRRTSRPTQAQVYAQQTLAVATAFAKQLSPWEYQVCKDLATGTVFTWKDLAISGFFGTAIEFVDPDGVLWQGRRILAADIQTLLDSISSTAGSVLVRTTNGWAALYPGTTQQVLTISPDTGLPDWRAAAGGGGGAELAAMFVPGGTSGDAFASLGYWFQFTIPAKIIALSALLRPSAAGHVYTLNCAPFDSTTHKITAAPTIAGTFTSTGSATNLVVAFNLATPITVAAGDKWAFWLSRTDSTPTAQPETYYTTSQPVASFYFTVPLANGLKLAKQAPTTADAWTTATAAWAMSFLYQP